MSPKYLAHALGVVLSTAAAAAGQPYSIEWQTQFGTARTDSGTGVATDPNGNVFLTGYSLGDLLGNNGIGSTGAFLRKYTSTGVELWTRQVGTPGANAVAVDSLGNAYISGYTTGAVANNDAFVTKFDSFGNSLWSKQIGLRGNDISNAVAVDPVGNVIISGYSEADDFHASSNTQDSFVAKFDSAGNLLWNKNVGVPEPDQSRAVRADSLGNVYLAGQRGNGGYLKKLDPQGDTVWTNQFNAARNDYSTGLAIDSSNNAYVTGYVYDAINDTFDAYLRKFDAAGDELWARMLDNTGPVAGSALAVDAAGSPFMAGTINDDPRYNSSSTDVFVVQYNSAGDQLWMDRRGSTTFDIANSIAVDGVGSIYLAGLTEGSLAGTNHLSGDAFLIKFAPVPEPCSLAMMQMAVVFYCAFVRRSPRRISDRPGQRLRSSAS